MKKKIKIIIFLLLWVLSGVIPTMYDYTTIRHNEVTVGNAIILGTSSGILGPVATGIVIFIHIDENWNTVVIKGK